MRSVAAQRSCARVVVIGRKAVQEFDQVAAPSGIVSCLPRRVTVECGYGFIEPLGFVLADELVEHRGHLGGVGVERILASRQLRR